jgi:Ferritin-like domain
MNRQTESTAADAPQPRTVGAGPIPRRSALRALGLAGVALGSGLGLASTASASGGPQAPGFGTNPDPHRRIPASDVAILRFLAAAEILETDLWRQYTELAVGNAPFAAALANLDGDMVQYISDNTDDEMSHAAFLNAFLASVGAQPVNLEPFRTLSGSTAKGATPVKWLTNLTALTVDTSWWLRYRSSGNPDFGDTFPQLINIVNRTAIPLRDDYPAAEIQAIANTAGFHFGTIEQGGTSLYASLIPKATDLDVIRILVGIGGSEVNHFAIWHDKAGNAPAVTVNGVMFPDLGTFNGDEARQTNLIMPEPCRFLRAGLPDCSVIRPSSTQNAGAVAAATALTNSGLFKGQSQQFFNTLNALAHAADAAERR